MIDTRAKLTQNSNSIKQESECGRSIDLRSDCLNLTNSDISLNSGVSTFAPGVVPSELSLLSKRSYQEPILKEQVSNFSFGGDSVASIGE